MSFFDIFKPFINNASVNSAKNIVNRLHGKLQNLLPEAKQDDLIEIACISGLMARVAYADMQIKSGEIEIIQQSLATWTTLLPTKATIVANMAVEEIMDLAGQENHLYTRPLNNLWNNDQKYNLLIALFAVAAGDQEVELKETDEIKNICKGLLLEHKHFLSARTTVLDKLKVLK